MSNSIDKRIVQMEFNNSGFQSKVQQTINSMKQLGESLKMKGATNGLSEVDRGIKGLIHSGLGSLGNNVDQVGGKFNTMAVVAATALSKVASAAIDTGSRLVKALTLDPILTGFEEYETKMNSITTILTNTAHQGTTLKDVNATLNELNTYADKTIYNFAEMTKNIGTFTAAGVDLKTSTAAIKGIANLAAASGSSSAQASTAMYQLSQALATGKVSLMDWNSVVNAGMGGKLFQDALIRTSEVMGTGAEAAIKKYGSFRDSLTQGEWLTGDVLTETLKQISGAYTEAELKAQGYTDKQAKAIVQLAENASKAATQVKTVSQLFDTMKESVQSGWAQSWEYIIGDKDQAAKLLTSISDGFNSIVGPSADARNAMLKFWNEAGGRDDVIAGLGNIWQGISKGVGAIGKAWQEVFPPMTGQKLVEISSKFKEFTSNFKMSDGTAQKLKNTFKGLFSVLNIGKNVVSTVIKAFTPFTKVFTSIGKVLLTVTSGIGQFFSTINDALNSAGIFDKISNGIDRMANTVSKALQGVSKGVQSFFKYLSKLDFSKAFSTVGGGFSKVFGGIGDIFSSVASKISSINFNTLFAAVNTIITGGALKSFKTIVGGIKDSVSSFADIFESLGKVTDILDAVKDSLVAYQENLSAGTLIKIAGAVALLAGSLLLLSQLNLEQMENGLVGITVIMGELVGAMYLLAKLQGLKGIGVLLSLGTFFIMFASAIGVLSLAVAGLSRMSWDDLAKGLTGVAGGLVILVAAVSAFNRIGGGVRLLAIGSSLMLLSASLAVLAGAVKLFSNMSWEDLGQGLIGVAGGLTAFVVFAKLMKGSSMSITTATGILVLGVALNALASAVKEFASIKWDELGRGLAGVAGMLAEIIVFNRLFSNATNLLITAAGLTAMAIGITALAGAVGSFASLDIGQLIRGLVGVGVALAEIAVFNTVSTGMGGNLIVISVGMTILAGALKTLAQAVQGFGSMSWEQLGIGLTGLAASLTILAVAMKLMSANIGGALAITALSVALALLVPQLVVLSGCDIKGLGVALGFLAGVFVIFGAAAFALSPLIPVMISLAGAMALLSVACLGFAVSTAAFGTGLAAIAGAGAAAGFALAEICRQLIPLLPKLGDAIGAYLVNMGKAVLEGVPALLEGLSAVLQALCDFIVQNAPYLVESSIKVLTLIIEALISALPKLLEVGAQLIITLAEGIMSHAAELINVGVDLIVTLINALVGRVGDLIQAGIDLAVAIVNGVADGLRNNQAQIIDAVVNLMTAIGETMMNAIPALVEGMFQAGGDIIHGLIEGILSAIDGIGQIISDLVDSIIRFFTEPLGIHSPSTVFKGFGVNIIEGLVQGIQSVISNPIKAIAELASKIIGEAAKQFTSSKLVKHGRDLIKGLGDGIKGFFSNPLGKITELGGQIKSFAQRNFNASTLVSHGRNLLTGLGNGIKGMIGSVTGHITALGGKIKSFAQRNFNASTLVSHGRNLLTGLGNGIKGMYGAVTGAISGLGSRIRGAAAGAFNGSTLVSYGRNLIQGLVNGVKGMVSSAVSAVRGVANKVVAAAKSAFKINSPSKRFIVIGHSIIEGLSTGMTRYSGEAMSTVRSVANDTVSVMRTALNTAYEALGNIIDEDINLQPEITPILNLQDVETGSRYIQSLLGNNLTISASGRLGASISGLQNGVRFTNSDVVQAIKELGNTIMNSPKGDTYTIDGITYDDGSNISDAIKTLVKATRMERRV